MWLRFASSLFFLVFTLVVGNTVLVVSPGFFILIKRRAAVPLFTKRSLQLHQLIGQIGNSSFMSVLILG
jgi:hypothetical protein